MRISIEWIRRLLGTEDLGVAPDRLAELLTLHVAEIESVEETTPELTGVVAGVVTTCEAHPDADRLSVCRVDVGADEVLTIVCGAPNVAAGQKVAVATVGTRLTMTGKDGAPTEVTIKRGRLRGMISEGMICAEDELGLGDAHDGILVLPDTAEPGTPLRTVLGSDDAVLLIDNHAINHRPDLWGHLGWAREVAAVLDLPPPPPCPVDWEDTGEGMGVTIEDPDRCLAYAGAVVTGVDNRESPRWLQNLLTAVGARPHGLLVDVTNFVMLELGEPMHAFDRRQIAGDRLRVRPAASGERFTTLDGHEHGLGSSDLLIADAERGLALAGIMGGENSMVADDTDTVVLEAACFQAAGIRRTRQATGLGTESSNRFEKGLYPELCPAAIKRAIGLLREAIPEIEVTARFHDGILATAPKSVDFAPNLIARRLGTELSTEHQCELLARIGLTADGPICGIPWWRCKDLNLPVDLAEEVGRLYGYERIAEDLPRVHLRKPTVDTQRRAEHRLRRRLAAEGWDEVLTYVFTDDRWADLLGWGTDAIRPGKPLASDQTVMRRSLLPTLAEAVGRNRRHLTAIDIYEIGNIYGPGLGTGDRPHERTQIAGIHCAVDDAAPFYAARDAARSVLEELGAEEAAMVTLTEDQGPFLGGRGVEFRLDDTVCATVAEVAPRVGTVADVEDRLAYFEVELERLVTALGRPPATRYRPPSRFQAVDREFTFVADEALLYGDLAAIIANAVGPLHRGSELLTIYRGEPIPVGRKAISLRVRLQADDRTLGEKELRKVSAKIVKAVTRRTGAELRG